MNIRYLNHLPDDLKDEAVALILDLLGEKFEPVLGKGERAHQVMVKGLDPVQCIVAVCRGKLAGILAIQEGDKSLMNPGLASLIRGYGILGGLFRLAGLWMLYHSPDPDELYVDGVVVAKSFQGKGLGSGLFTALEKRARDQGMKKITLEVIDTNPRALALYNRLGFTEVATEDITPFNRIFGFPFEASVLMEKALGGEEDS